MNNQHEANIANPSVASLMHSDAMICAFCPREALINSMNSTYASKIYNIFVGRFSNSGAITRIFRLAMAHFESHGYLFRVNQRFPSLAGYAASHVRSPELISNSLRKLT